MLLQNTSSSKDPPNIASRHALPHRKVILDGETVYGLYQSTTVTKCLDAGAIHSDPEGILPRAMERTGHNHPLPNVSPTPGGEEELLGRN